MPPEVHLDPAGLDLSRIVVDQEGIRRVNPQRFEMEHLNAIVYIDNNQHVIVGYKDVRPDEFWVRGHMPDYPLLPGVLMCEAAAQLCSYYTATQGILQGDFIAFGGMENVRFRGTVHPGDRLVIVGKATRLHRRQTIFNVQSFVGNAMILCLAGACVAIALRDYVPEYLKRFGMELEWAHRLGIKMRFFNVLVLVVVFVFHANIAALQWVYATSVLVLLSSGSFAALADLRERYPAGILRRLATAPVIVILIFLLTMTVLTVFSSRAGLEIALAFGVGILATSIVSRWIRSTELRFRGFEFVDDESRQRWERCCAHEFQVLVPHRPGLHSRIERERVIRERHRIGPETPVILIEAELDDPSDFYQLPLMRVVREDGFELILVSRCVSVAHVIAAIALEMAKIGRPPELHFGWSDESPLAANVNFLLFGEGNIPWMVRALVQKAEPNPDKRPCVIVG